MSKLLAARPQPTWRVVEVVGNFYERHGRAERGARSSIERFAASDVDTDAAAPGSRASPRAPCRRRCIATPRDGAAEALFDLASLLDQGETLDAALDLCAPRARRSQPNFPLAQMLVGEIRESEDRPADALALYQAPSIRNRPLPGRRSCARRSSSMRSAAPTRRSRS